MAEVGASTRLTLKEIENELSEVTATDWYPLGVQLGLRPATLTEILRNYLLDTERCKQEVLHVWLCSTPEASWMSLAQAVQALGRYESLVQKLRRKVPPGPKVPSAPTIVYVEATSSTSISVYWESSENNRGSPITGYMVEYSPTSNPSFETQVVARDVFSTSLDGLTPSTEYDVRVRGENAVGRSVPSAIKTAKTDDEVTESVDSVGNSEEETDPQVKKEKLLREATENNDMDSFHRHLDELERLLSDDDMKKRQIKESLLCYAAHLGFNPVVEALIQKGVDINTMSTVPEHPDFSFAWVERTPLHWAARGGYGGAVELLLQAGADVTIKDNDGWTPLHMAARGGHVGAVEYIIQAGADVNVKDNRGRTPLHRAALESKDGTVQLLIEKGADINIKNSFGETPLHWAAEEGHAGTAQFLVEKGADINIKDISGATPLHKAAKWGHVGAVDYLIQAGADVNIKDDDGETPLDWATRRGREAIVAYLKRAADPKMLKESESTGRQQEQRQSPQETDNTPSEEQPATGEKEEESDDKEIDLQVQNLLAKYRHQPIIKHKSLKCLFTGPPRVGKSTLKKRLLKTIKNLLDSGLVSPSGGLEKPITVIIGETRECVTVVMQSDIDWKPQHDLIDEAQIVLQFIDKSHISPPTPGPKPLPKKVPHTPAPATGAFAELSYAKVVPSISGPDPPTPGEALDDATKLIKEVLASRKLHSIEDMEKTTTLYFMDTGGQPEFHEIMPIILNGPALHLIFFNLTFDLDDPISIQFCKPDGTNSTITYKSSYTGKQMIYQLLSSLYYLSKDMSPDSKPAAVLIATYLDQLKDLGEQGEKKMDEISDSLNKLLKKVEFHSKGFLTYPTEGKATVFIPINNYSGDEEEIHRLQAFLKQVIDDRFAPVELPSSWLLFHLVLRHHYENSPGVCKLAECQALAKGCGLVEKDVPQVLQYIHRHLGTILFYEEVEGLNELVICDPNVLFNSIYHLVAVSFAGVKAHHTSADEIRKTGEIPSEELQHISTQPGSSLLTTKHIVNLLKHFKILTEMVSDDSLTYFMPCLLHHDSLALSCEALKSLGPPPLLVSFDGNYIPIGVFSALVVKLSQCSWEPDRDIRYRNHILFNTDGVFPVELRVHPAYLEFRITIINYKEEEPTEIHEFCMEVCKTVVDTLKSILNLHEHTKKTKFQLGFYCPGSFQADGQPHFCGCLPRRNYINPKSFVCSKSSQCQKQCRLPPECTIWFDCWKDKTVGRVWDYVCSSDYASRTAASTPLTVKEIQNELNEMTVAKWCQLGVQLGISPATLSTIESDYPHDAQRCMTEVIIKWLQNAPEFPWAKLAEAVEAMGGYAALAEKLRQKISKGAVASPTGSLPPQLSSTPAPVDIHGAAASSERGQLHPQPPSTPASTTIDILSKKPKLAQLKIMKTTTGEKIKIIESVAPQWKELGDLLDFDSEGRTLELIEANNQQKGPVACCREMFVYWLKGKGREATWGVLIELLDDIDQSELARKVKTALPLVLLAP